MKKKDRFKILDQQHLFDSHSHLNRQEFDDDRNEVVKRATEAGVISIVDVATDNECALESLELSRKYPEVVYPTIGVHPDRFMPGKKFFSSSWTNMQEDVFKEMRKLLDMHSEFVMIGECGLDYYWLERMDLSDTDKKISKDLQIQAFQEQVDIAKEYDLPLTIHARDAFDDCLNIMRQYTGEVEAVFHSFTGDYSQLKQIIDAGFKIGINGIVTFKNASQLQEALAQYLRGIEIDSAADLYARGIFLETDAPFLSPGKHRGKRNESAFIPEMLQFIQAST